MKCKIDGCSKEVMYKGRGICQMHYFRYMRNGTYNTVITRKYRTQNPAGYQKLHEPGHVLANKDGNVYEHRFVLYNNTDAIGSPVTCCDICGDKINWSNLHVDHVDEDVTNNHINNLRPTCRSCNTFRGHNSESMGKIILTIHDRPLTPEAWSRQEGVKVTGATIRHRFKSGMSDYDCVYLHKKTHKNKDSKTKKLKYDEVRGVQPARELEKELSQ